MKYTILIFLCWAYISTVFGQNNDDRRFTASVVAGFNLSQIDGDAYAGYNKIGFSVGARGGVILGRRFELNTEILFSQKGSQSEMVRGIPRALLYNLNYVDIPVEFTFKDWEATDSKGRKFMRINVGGGFSYGRLLGGRRVLDGFVQPDPLATYRKNDFMFLFSGTVFFTRNWGLNLRWARSIVSITNTNLTNAEISHMIVLRAVFAL